MSYLACPCSSCRPSTTKGRRDWKRMLHKSARARSRRIVSEELRSRHAGDE